ncbi:MAG: hypothetical protein ACI97K_000814 [Glaciecola sp.]|jgi:hypothetical protein
MDILLSKELKILHENSVSGLDRQQLFPEHILDKINTLIERKDVEVHLTGKSFLGKPINCLKLGRGPTKIIMWSQMHGDEPTATAALLDLTYLLTTPLLAENSDVGVSPYYQDKITIYILPMLNPDGAKQCERENAQGIDINRDALALQTPEGKLLNALVDEIEPDYAFNLHDQHDYYRCGNDGKSTTLAFLAPAFDNDKSINAPRQRAMALITDIYEKCDSLIPHGIARYDDEFSPRSFGDQIAAKGISTILIESGHYPNDDNRQVARTLNVYALLHSISKICAEDVYSSKDVNDALERKYWQIPENNENKVCDMLIKNLSFSNRSYQADIAVCKRSRFESHIYVNEVGDLSQLHGIETIEAGGYTYEAGRPYQLSEEIVLSNHHYITLLKKGFSHFVGSTNLIKNQSDYKLIENPEIWHDEHKMKKGTLLGGFFCMKGERKFALLIDQIVQF